MHILKIRSADLITGATTQICLDEYRRQRTYRVTSLAALAMALTLIGEIGTARLAAAGIALLVLIDAILLRWITLATTKLKDARAAPAILLVGLGTSTYLGAGLSLATHPLASVNLLGFLWIAAEFLRIGHDNRSVPVLMLASLLAAGLVALAFPLALSWAGPRSQGLAGWVLPFLMLPMFLAQSWRVVAPRGDAQDRTGDRLKQLEHEANHDKLTGLLNRAAFDLVLQEALDSKRRVERRPVLFLLDLNGFKPINDTYGHGAGDVILKAVAERILTVIRDDGHAARIGGDEFAVLLPDIDNVEDAETVACRMVETVAEHVACGQRALSVSVSIGVALQRDVGQTATDLLAAADKAMYRAKGANGTGYAVFDATLDAPKLTTEETVELEDALRLGQIVPYYQPKVDLATGALIGFEALARWEHPTKGVLPPSEFIPRIEKLGLQSEFTYRIARRVFSQVNNLVSLGLDPGQVAINISELSIATVSGRQDIEWLFAENPRSVNHITLEITENVFIARAGDMMQQSIRKLRNLGVRISLDDFGTGFASFQHLRQLDFDELKIDTGFVQGLGSDPVSDVIVDGFISIATGLGVDVVAEGVETETQRAFLLDRGCRVGQGYLFSKAMPIEQVIDLLKVDKPSGSIKAGKKM